MFLNYILSDIIIVCVAIKSEPVPDELSDVWSVVWMVCSLAPCPKLTKTIANLPSLPRIWHIIPSTRPHEPSTAGAYRRKSAVRSVCFGHYFEASVNRSVVFNCFSCQPTREREREGQREREREREREGVRRDKNEEKRQRNVERGSRGKV